MRECKRPVSSPRSGRPWWRAKTIIGQARASSIASSATARSNSTSPPRSTSFPMSSPSPATAPASVSRSSIRRRTAASPIIIPTSSSRPAVARFGSSRPRVGSTSKTYRNGDGSSHGATTRRRTGEVDLPPAFRAGGRMADQPLYLVRGSGRNIPGTNASALRPPAMPSARPLAVKPKPLRRGLVTGVGGGPSSTGYGRG